MPKSALVCLCLVLGCGDDSSPSTGSTSAASQGSSSTAEVDSSSSGGPTIEEAIVEATIDATTQCGGAAELRLIAWRFACVGGGPCTVADPPTQLDGTAIACPSDAGETTVSVTLTQGGRYRVELVATLDNGAAIRECYGADGSDEVIIGPAELSSGEPIVVAPTGSPCPQ